MTESACDWNQRYLQGDTPWDKGAAHPILAELLENGDFFKAAEVLVPGCGFGHDARVIADAGHRVTGLDLSESAVAGAQLVNGGDGLTFQVGDLLDAKLATRKQYDVVWEHTCFCAILPEQRDAYVAAVHRFLKPGGILLGVFFAFGDDEKGPPFKTNIETIHRHIERGFTLVWERKPEQFFPTREGAEWLMCWQKNESLLLR